MLPLDCIYHIVIHANYKLTLKFIQTCTYFAEDPDIWKRKCQIQYPLKPYFDFWLGKENYLVCQHKRFAIGINFDSPGEVSNCLYEYSPMLTNILSESIANRMDSDLLGHFIDFEVKCRYVIVRLDCDYESSVVGQYTTRKKTKKAIMIDQLSLEATTYNDEFSYVIIDLKKTAPYFWSVKNFRHASKNPGTFYRGSIHQFILSIRKS